MGIVVIFDEFPMWEWHFDLVLDTILITAKATIRVYIFCRRSFWVSIISPHFILQDLYADIVMTKLTPIFQLYVAPFFVGTYSDPSMMTPINIIEIDPSEATPLHVIHLDSKATSSTRESHVSSRGQGYGAGFSG